jgi:hypothetical protein
MIKEKVLEVIRYLQLTIDNKKDVATCYNTVSQAQKDNFSNSVKCYEGRINYSFSQNLYDKYVYALNAKLNGTGITMFDYLMTNGKFKDKRPSSFKI